MGPKSRGQLGYAPSTGSRGESVPCLFQLLKTASFLGLWIFTAIIPIYASVIPAPSLTLVDVCFCQPSYKELHCTYLDNAA